MSPAVAAIFYCQVCTVGNCAAHCNVGINLKQHNEYELTIIEADNIIPYSCYFKFSPTCWYRQVSINYYLQYRR